MADKDYKVFIVEGEVRESQIIDNILIFSLKESSPGTIYNSANSFSILISILSPSLPLNVHASETGSTHPSLAK